MESWEIRPRVIKKQDIVDDHDKVFSQLQDFDLTDFEEKFVASMIEHIGETPAYALSDKQRAIIDKMVDKYL